MPDQVFRRQILYDVYWQKIRMSFLGGWGHAEGVKGNLMVLRTYVSGGIKNSDPVKVAMRLYRVRNLLNAVLLGQHVGDRVLVEATRNEYDALQDEYPLIEEPWDWSIVALQLRSEKRKTLHMLRQNLVKRRRVAAKRGVDPKDTRPELEVFLGLIDTEVSRRNAEEIDT